MPSAFAVLASAFAHPVDIYWQDEAVHNDFGSRGTEEALRLHPELQCWRDADYQRAENKSGENWRLHLQLDAVILRRASDDSLPHTRVIRELERRGEKPRRGPSTARLWWQRSFGSD